mgnify:CR=1 FL=1
MCTYKVTDEVMFTDVDREYVLLHAARGEYFSLNEMGRTMFDLIKTKKSCSEVIKSILNQYDVDREVVATDLAELIQSLVASNLLVRND